jgi:dihydroorotase
MKKYLIKNIQVINENTIQTKDVLIANQRFLKIDNHISASPDTIIIDGTGKYLIPGLIDDQVHFREPGLTHKGSIYTEAKAAVAGGITTFMEMPNTNPPTLNTELLEEKYTIAQHHSLANYSFYMGASNDNLDNILGIDYTNVCGIKVFMGSSTGDMLVDNDQVLDELFRNAPVLIATHCEDEHTVQTNLAAAKTKFGDHIPITEHPIIRSREACLRSSTKAIDIAKKYNTRLHILHISTKEEC